MHLLPWQAGIGSSKCTQLNLHPMEKYSLTNLTNKTKKRQTRSFPPYSGSSTLKHYSVVYFEYVNPVMNPWMTGYWLLGWGLWHGGNRSNPLPVTVSHCGKFSHVSISHSMSINRDVTDFVVPFGFVTGCVVWMLFRIFQTEIHVKLDEAAPD